MALITVQGTYRQIFILLYIWNESRFTGDANLKDMLKLDGRAYIRQNILMEELGITLITLYSWRDKGILPEPIKIGAARYYDREQVHKHLVTQGSGGEA